MKQIYRSRRLTALLLALVMIFSLAPAALAEESSYPYFSPGNIEFSTAQEGYSVGEDENYDVNPFSANIYGNPDGPNEALTLSLEGQNADAFSVSPTSVSATESVYDLVTVTPDTGLTEGTYTATLKAVGETVSITAPISFTVTKAPAFVAVTGIIGLPTSMTAGTPLTLKGTVEPNNATVKNITWELVTDGTTAPGANISNGILTATGAGEVKVLATVTGGANDGNHDYTQEFTITVNAPAPAFVAVTNITGVPTSMTAGTSLTLTGTVKPENATNKEIAWSLVREGATAAGASVSDGVLTATGPGNVKVLATVAGGTDDGNHDYTQEFTINVTESIDPSDFFRYDSDTANYVARVRQPEFGGSYIELIYVYPKQGVTQLTVPSEMTSEKHGTLTVKRVRQEVFSDHPQNQMGNLTAITLPDTVQSIGEDNFVGLPALVSVNLPTNLNTMEPGCFRNLPELTELTFPASLTLMHHGSVKDNPKLGKVTYLGAPQIGDRESDSDMITLPLPFTGCAEGFTIYGPAATPMQGYAEKKGIAYVVPTDQWDYFPFANSYDDFFRSGEAQRYNLTDNDWQVMHTNLTKGGNTAAESQYNALKYYSNTTAWGGSCYGIAVTEGLFSYGYLGSNALAAGKPSAAAAPRADDQVESMINYHFLLQLLPDFAGEITWGCRQDGQYYYLNQRVDYTGTLRALVQTVEQRPVLLCYWFPVQVQGGYALSGHAIIVHTAEKVSDTEYRLLAEDNRFPGQDTPITVSLSGNGDMNLSYPAGYRGSENMLGIRYTGDFKQFYSQMPYRDPQWRERVWRDHFLLDGPQSVKMEVDENGMIRLRPAAATLAEDDAVIQLPTTSDGRISLRNMIVSSTADGQPAPTRFLYDVQDVNGIILENDPDQPVNLSYATSSGFSGVSAAGAGTVTLDKDGTVEGQDLNGPVTLATSAGDGTLITVKGTAAGAETDDFKLTPGQGGASITAPAGTYTVDMSTQDGRETTSTVTSDGMKPVDVQTPPPPPTPSGGGSSGGGGSTSGAGVTAETAKNGAPTTGVVKPSATVKDGAVKVTVSDRDIQNAIDKALSQAKKDKVEDSGISVAIDLTGLGRAFDKLPLTLSKATLNNLVQAEVKALTIRTGQITLSLDMEALKAIADAATGDVTLTAARADLSALDVGAKEALTGRPAYDLTVKSGSKTISDFGKGFVTITLPYTLQGGEQADGLRLAWVDAEGKVQTLDGSGYDAALKAVTGETGHFTLFGITERKTAPAFSDISGHWAADDILFVAARGLLNGTGNGAFTPNGTMTRGMAVTALYRLAGSPQADGEGGAFTDVPANAYYADAVAWASSKGIVKGTTATTFDPDRAVTRQELAVIMSGYAQAMGHKLPTGQAPVTFADTDAIGSWALDAVQAIQRAGIMNGKDGNRFDPTGTATRAEVAAVLRRFTEAVIDT